MSGSVTTRPRLRPPYAFSLATLVMLASLAAGCAPPAPGTLESLEGAARTGAHRRERRLQGLEARAVLRVDGRATGRLPAVSVTTRLAAPDRLRLQARWLLGVLLDAVVASDTLTAWMPSERLGLRLPGLADSLRIREPARFLGRAIVAGWQAPAEAWRGARADSAGVSLDWREGNETWGLRLDTAGRPSELSVARDSHRVTVRYSGWHGPGAAALPSRVELRDGDGWLHVRMDLEDVHSVKKVKPAWFRLSLPDDFEPLALDDLRRVLSLREKLR